MFNLYIKHVAFFIMVMLHHKWIVTFWGDIFNKFWSRLFLVMSKRNTAVYLLLSRKEEKIYIQGLAGLVACIFNYWVSRRNPAIESSAKCWYWKRRTVSSFSHKPEDRDKELKQSFGDVCMYLLYVASLGILKHNLASVQHRLHIFWIEIDISSSLVLNILLFWNGPFWA